MIQTTRFVTEITVKDPDTGDDVALEVHKDPQSGALLAVDSSFLDQVEDTIPSPFNSQTMLKLPEPE